MARLAGVVFPGVPHDLTQRGNVRDDGMYQYKHDAWNRVVEVYDDNDGDGEADEGELIVSYEYDGQRRLVERTVEGDPDVTYDNYYNSGPALRSLGGGGWELLEARRGDDADPQDHYVWDLRYIDAPVARFHDGNTDGDYDDAEDNILCYTTDAKFNVTAVIDESGNVVERYAYDSYGAVTVLDGTTGGQTDWATDADQVSDVANEILYSGYRYDAETGLYTVRNRIYHPTLGRFLQRDPLGYADGISVYQYVGSAPMLATDPSGEAVVAFTGWEGDHDVKTSYNLTRAITRGVHFQMAWMINYSAATGAVPFVIGQIERTAAARHWCPQPIYVAGYSYGARAALVFANDLANDRRYFSAKNPRGLFYIRALVFFDYNFAAFTINNMKQDLRPEWPVMREPLYPTKYKSHEVDSRIPNIIHVFSAGNYGSEPAGDNVRKILPFAKVMEDKLAER